MPPIETDNPIEFDDHGTMRLHLKTRSPLDGRFIELAQDGALRIDGYDGMTTIDKPEAGRMIEMLTTFIAMHGRR